MPSNDLRKTFTPQHHALLFGWIAREVMLRAGDERGEEVLRKAVRRYAEQRGLRMALRAQSNGHELNMLSFLAYGEWRAEGGESESSTVERSPHLRKEVHKCPWQGAWEANDLLPYGRFYCLEVDEGLARGFNPDLRLEVLGTLTNDGVPCDFVFHGADLNQKNTFILGYRHSLASRKGAVMPWDYHCGHLFKTVGEIVVAELGQEGKEAILAARTEFAQRFGEAAIQIVEGYLEADFDSLPD
jgi:hypothetical protein